MKTHEKLISLLGLFVQVLTAVKGQSTTQNGADVSTTVLIIGAGTAGMKLAEEMLENGVTDFKIIEQGSDVGSPVVPEEFGGITVSTGEIYNYGHSAADFNDKGLGATEFTWDTVVRNDDAEDVTNDYYERWDIMSSALTAAIDDIAQPSLDGKRPSVSAKTAMAIKGWLASSPIDRITEWFDFQFNEGVSMDDFSMAGVLSQELRTENPGSWFYINDYGDGLYSELKERLVSGSQIDFNTEAKHIHQTDDKVMVTADQYDYSGSEAVRSEVVYAADYVISTLGVGHLQSGALHFEPPLPPWKTEQIMRFRSTAISTVYMKFASKFWDDSEFILHASDDLHWPAFLNLDREGFHPGSRILAAHLAWDEAVRVESMSAQAAQEEVLGVLEDMYGEENVANLEEIKFSHVTGKPLYGTFTTFPIDVSNPPDIHKRMGARVGRVFFADMAGSEVHLGRQIGSEEEAVRVAHEVLQCLGGECPERYHPLPYHRCEAGDRVYGCIRDLLGEGKTRKVRPRQPRPTPESGSE